MFSLVAMALLGVFEMVVGAAYVYHGKIGLGIAFICFSFSCVGFLLDLRGY